MCMALHCAAHAQSPSAHSRVSSCWVEQEPAQCSSLQGDFAADAAGSWPVLAPRSLTQAAGQGGAAWLVMARTALQISRQRSGTESCA